MILELIVCSITVILCVIMIPIVYWKLIKQLEEDNKDLIKKLEKDNKNLEKNKLKKI